MYDSPSLPASIATDDADSIFRRVALRFMPLLFVGYVVAYLDRVNVGFAKLQMLNSLHLSEAVYGLGAGLFFVGYFFFEVPSNLLLHRIGARRWIARIMITWAALSMATAWVSTPMQFYAVRFLLGVAEAGFFPGMVLYLTYWFPSHRRGKMIALLMAGNPVSGLIGGPASGWIMHSMSGVGGFEGWQWLFIIEAVPSIVLGFVILKHLDDRVADATWLSEPEKRVILDEIAADTATQTHGSVRAVFTSARVYLMCLILFGIVMGSYAIGFWQPTILRSTGIEDAFIIGLLTMIPYSVALIAMILTGKHADRTRERRWHVALPALIAGAGFVLCALFGASSAISVAGLTLATAGVITALPMFWALPTAFLGGTGAAAGIALINCTGNLAGFVSPAVIGWLKSITHSLSSGLFVVAASLALSALLIFVFVPAKLVNK
ncbi:MULTISPECIES: MFS transporter [unclassified Caballeronia]|uniref:MFS transporter n=1 Tax=unclassified Caballeronia TaxID=2646786 RepID=UPI00285DC8E3|nr:MULTISPECIES: MFS transporter [unclassified Caballeronia]MDR5773211.1 MFS transporter [Caballeronia sp. LZ002]MDR5800196.1 MFS transporter [Caballeronia sp. LZ001]MDR5848645.1 MFS transporter [Caballeronia sp. LZ003]